MGWEYVSNSDVLWRCLAYCLVHFTAPSPRTACVVAWHYSTPYLVCEAQTYSLPLSLDLLIILMSPAVLLRLSVAE